MVQYCRYCSHCYEVEDNYLRCTAKKVSMFESQAKRANRCNLFAFNEIDVFDPDRTYRPRKPREVVIDDGR